MDQDSQRISARIRSGTFKLRNRVENLLEDVPLQVIDAAALERLEPLQRVVAEKLVDVRNRRRVAPS